MLPSKADLLFMPQACSFWMIEEEDSNKIYNYFSLPTRQINTKQYHNVGYL